METDDEEPAESTRVDGHAPAVAEQDEPRTVAQQMDSADARAEEMPDLEAEPATAVRRDVVPIDAKATLELDDTGALHDPIDDGWGGHSEDTGSHTNSKIVRTSESAVIAASAVAATPAADEDPEAPRLICIEGPDEGREFVLTGRDVSIGRATDNDVTLNDPSVSRLHCRILIDEGQYVATDQRSGNGTIVNGRRIERQSLKSGNTLKMGQTTLRFIEMGDVIKSTETAAHKADELERSRIVSGPVTSPKARFSDRSTKKAILIVAAAALLAVVIVVLGLSGQPPAGVTSTPLQIGEEALKDAETELKARQFAGARERVSKAQSTLGSDPRVADLLARIGAEEAAQRALIQAKTARREDALRLLDAIGETSMFHAEATVMRIGLEEKKPLHVTPPPKAPAAAPTPKTEPASTRQALDAFMKGDAEGALEYLTGSLDDHGLALKNKILKFQEVFAEAQGSGDDKAVKKALAFESKIAQGRSGYAVQLKRLGAEAAYNTGMRLMQEQRQLEAYRAFKDALQMNPDHPNSKRKMVELQAQARDVFNQGYILKDSDRVGAREKWQRVLAMVPPDDDTHQKAKKWLEAVK